MDYKRKAMKLIYENFDELAREREQNFKKIKDDYKHVILCGIDDTDDIMEVLKHHGIDRVAINDSMDKMVVDNFYIVGDNLLSDVIEKETSEKEWCMKGESFFSKEIEDFYSLQVHDVAPSIGDLFGILGDEESNKIIYELVLVLLSNYEDGKMRNIVFRIEKDNADFENQYKLGINLWKIPLELKKRNPLCKIYIRHKDEQTFVLIIGGENA